MQWCSLSQYLIPSSTRSLICRRGHLELLGAMEAEVQRAEAEILSSGGSLPQLKVGETYPPMHA